MSHDRFSPEEEKEVERLYADWLIDQNARRLPRSHTEALVRSIGAYLKKNPGAVITLEAAASGTAALLAFHGHAPLEMQGALAALCAAATTVGALRLLKKARRPKNNRRHDQVGGLNQDARVDWRPFENAPETHGHD